MNSPQFKSEVEKEIYFIVLYKRKEKEKLNDFCFSKNNYKIINIYNRCQLEEDLYFYKKVFKLFIKFDNISKENKVTMSFIIGGI